MLRVHIFNFTVDEGNGPLNLLGNKKEGKHLRRSTEYKMAVRSPFWFFFSAISAAAPACLPQGTNWRPGKLEWQRDTQHISRRQNT